MQIAPECEGPNIDRHVDLVARAMTGDICVDSLFQFGAGMILAQGEHFRKIRLSCSGRIRSIIRCFLAVNPGRPDIQSYTSLAKSLLHLSGLHGTVDMDSGLWMLETRGAKKT